MPPMTPLPAFSVVIPSHRAAEDLDGTLRALRGQSLQPAAVIVVDDGSRRDDLEARCQAFGAKLLRSETRRGFARACNLGARGLRSEWIVFLNDDAVPERQWLDELASAARQWPEAGFLCPLCLRDDDRVDGAGDDLTWVGRPIRRGFGEPLCGELERPRALLCANATATAWKRSLFEALGAFDEELDMIYEDSDLSLRMSMAGHDGRYVPRARVRHRSGTTRAAWPDESIRLEARNLLLLAYKNLPASTLMRMLPWQLAHTIWAGLVSLSRGQLRPWLVGKGQALLRLPGLSTQRRRAQALRRMPTRALEARLDAKWHRLRALRLVGLGSTVDSGA